METKSAGLCSPSLLLWFHYEVNGDGEVVEDLFICLSDIFYSSFFKKDSLLLLGFPDGSEGKASAHNVGDLGSIPGSGKSPGEGNGNPLQYSCLENPMDGEAW